MGIIAYFAICIEHTKRAKVCRNTAQNTWIHANAWMVSIYFLLHILDFGYYNLKNPIKIAKSVILHKLYDYIKLSLLHTFGEGFRDRLRVRVRVRVRGRVRV